MEQCSICLEALDGGVVALATCGHRFHAACLAQMAGAVGTTTTRRGSLTACPNCRTVSRVAPVTTPAVFSVGDRVLALWGHNFYPGVVDEVVDGGRAYEIAWDDGDENRVLAKNVRVEAPAAPVIVGQSSAANDGARATSSVEVLEDDDDRSISSAAFGIESSATSFSASGEGLRAPAPAAAPEEEPAATPRRLMRCGNCQACRGRKGRPCSAPVPVVPKKMSRFTGVTRERERWRASISVRGARVELGEFDDEEDAARAYDAAVAKYELSGRTLNFPGEEPLASALAALPELDGAAPSTSSEYDAIVATAASDTAAPRQERALAARRVAPPAPVPQKRSATSSAPKPVEMRRVGDAAWRWFGSLTDAAKAFGVSQVNVSELVRNTKSAQLRGTFEARPAPPKKCERPTKRKAGGGKKAKTVEGAAQKKNGKWASQMFPGREFDDLDAYRAAKKQRAAQRAAWSAQAY